jgi:DNA-binding response OmpR family regulator
MNGFGKGTVLIVEDEPSFRRIYADVLGAGGYEVITASDGESGWECARTKKPDLILLDLILPRLHGLDLLKRIRDEEETRDIPVIIFSVMGSSEDIQKAMALGASDYTTKGFYSPKQILSKVTRILENQKAPSGPAQASVYRLRIDPNGSDARQLQSDLGMPRSFECDNCSAHTELEIISDSARTDGRWFWAHFKCPHCDKVF